MVWPLRFCARTREAAPLQGANRAIDEGNERSTAYESVREVSVARKTHSRTQAKGVDDAWIPANRSGPSFAKIRDGLLVAARDGDADAASQLSHATQFCRWAKQQAEIAGPTPTLVPDGNWNALREDERVEDMRVLDNWRRASVAAERNRWYCVGTEEIVADDRAMLEAELMAARLGDVQAADCSIPSAAMFASSGTHMARSQIMMP